MKFVLLITTILTLGSFTYAATDWSNVSITKLPTSTFISINKDVEFSRSSSYESLGEFGSGNSSFSCQLQLTNPYQNGIVLDGPITLTSVNVIAHDVDSWGAREYVISGKSNKASVSGLVCYAGSQWQFGISVDFLVGVIEQVGTIKIPDLPGPGHE